MIPKQEKSRQENILREGQDVKHNKDLKKTTITIFKELKEIILKEVKEVLVTMSY